MCDNAILCLFTALSCPSVLPGAGCLEANLILHLLRLIKEKEVIFFYFHCLCLSVFQDILNFTVVDWKPVDAAARSRLGPILRPVGRIRKRLHWRQQGPPVDRPRIQTPGPSLQLRPLQAGKQRHLTARPGAAKIGRHRLWQNHSERAHAWWWRCYWCSQRCQGWRRSRPRRPPESAREAVDVGRTGRAQLIRSGRRHTKMRINACNVTTIGKVCSVLSFILPCRCFLKSLPFPFFKEPSTPFRLFGQYDSLHQKCSFYLINMWKWVG